MTDNQSETAKVEILPGVQLTPEAQAILNKQLNRKIVWGYHSAKFVFRALSLLPLLISAFFAYGVAVGGIGSLAQLGLAVILICGPVLGSVFLFRLASRY